MSTLWRNSQQCVKYFKVFNKTNYYNHIRLSSSSEKYLIDDPNYSFLKDDLGLQRTNIGVYNGKWNADGKVS